MHKYDDHDHFVTHNKNYDSRITLLLKRNVPDTLQIPIFSLDGKWAYFISFHPMHRKTKVCKCSMHFTEINATFLPFFWTLFLDLF